MQTLTLQAIPNQEFTVSLDGVLYDVRLIETNGCMSVDIMRAGVVVELGARCVAGQALIDYAVQENGFGNFIFLTGNNNTDLPYYDQFGTTQTLIYASAAELAAVRGTNAAA